MAAHGVEEIWAETGHQYRAGLSNWRLYEHLTMAQQHQMLEASATAVCLLENSDTTGRGREVGLFLPEPDIEIDPGRLRSRGPSPAGIWMELWPVLTATADEARRDPEMARRLFNFIVGCRRKDKAYVQRVRDSFEELGIPTKF